MNYTYNITTGLDVGSMYTKGYVKINDHIEKICIPSYVTDVARCNLYNTNFCYVNDIFNNLCITLSTDMPCTHINNYHPYYLFGKKSEYNTDYIRNEFNTQPKSEQELFYCLIFGCLSGSILKAFCKYNDADILQHDENIEITGKICLSTSLPLQETSNITTCISHLTGLPEESITQKIDVINPNKGSIHRIHIHGFKCTITVNLWFYNVSIITDCLNTQYVLLDKLKSSPQFYHDTVNDALDAYKIFCENSELSLDEKKIFIDAISKITDIQNDNISETVDIRKPHNAMLIDIGHNITTFAVFVKDDDETVMLDKNLYQQKNIGYGKVIDNALADPDISFANHKNEFIKYLAKDIANENGLPLKTYNYTKNIVNKYSYNIANKIIDAFLCVIDEHAKECQECDVVYVIGGGSIILKPLIYYHFAKKMALSYNIPVLFVPNNQDNEAMLLNAKAIYQFALEYEKKSD